MLVRCWGSRGATPVSGTEYNKYGGDTTCLEIRTKDDRVVIVDAGTGIRRLGNKLMAEERFSYDLFFTHAHWDHLMGFPFFKPIYHNETHIRMQGCPFAQQFVETMLTTVLGPPNFPVRYEDLKAKFIYEPECAARIEIGTLSVIPIPISHPNRGNGYKFIEDGVCFVFLTDNELGYPHGGGRSFREYRRFCEGADVLIHDAEFTPEEYENTRGWGHSVYHKALELALGAGVKRFGLFHMNQDRTDEAVDAMVQDCKRMVQAEGVDLDVFALGADMCFEV